MGLGLKRDDDGEVLRPETANPESLMARSESVGFLSARQSRAPSLVPAAFLSDSLSVSPAMSSLPNCHQYACAIQACITRNNANSDKCPREIMALYECCERLYRTLDSEGKGENKEGVPGSEACPNLVSRLSSLSSHGR